MSEIKGTYHIQTEGGRETMVPVKRPGPTPGATPMQYKGGDITPEIRAVYAEYDYSCFRMAAEIVRLRAELEHIEQTYTALVNEAWNIAQEAKSESKTQVE